VAPIETEASRHHGSSATASVILLFSVLKTPLIEEPAAVAPVAIAREINPTIRPYSRALDPLSSEKSRRTIAILVPSQTVAPTKRLLRGPYRERKVTRAETLVKNF
jgi:hypothetical protein